MLNKIKAAWDWTKAFFNRSWSIFIARLEMLLGFAIAAMSAMDFAPLLSAANMGLTWTQGAAIGGVLFIKGVVSELGRRANTRTMANGQLLPSNVQVKSITPSPKVSG